MPTALLFLATLLHHRHGVVQEVDQRSFDLVSVELKRGQLTAMKFELDPLVAFFEESLVLE